jgi:hypothetical protein
VQAHEFGFYQFVESELIFGTDRLGRLTADDRHRSLFVHPLANNLVDKLSH